MAHIRQSRPDSSLGFHEKALKIFVRCSLFPRKRMPRTSDSRQEMTPAQPRFNRLRKTSGHLRNLGAERGRCPPVRGAGRCTACSPLALPRAAPCAPPCPEELLITEFIKEDSPFCLTRAITRTMIGPCPRSERDTQWVRVQPCSRDCGLGIGGLGSLCNPPCEGLFGCRVKVQCTPLALPRAAQCAPPFCLGVRVEVPGVGV